MHIESVTAKGFGALQNQTLTVHPGLTVICGRNESAKSTWHAAVYAALCGRARKRGPGSKASQEFAARYRPWDGTTWEVEATVRLDDGRLVHLHHDLDGQVNCAATDVLTGRDLSAEVMYDGAPDASRWLGMNRDIFSAIACVRQADILGVLGSADGLQKQLESAATHAGTTDPTAAQALGVIDAFLKENVGKDRAKSTKPLRRAIEEVQAGSTDLEQARVAHAQYIELVREAQRLRSEVADYERRVEAAALRKAEQRNTDLQERLHAVDRLRVMGADRRPAATSDTHAVTQVTRAVTRWHNRPIPPELTGPDAAALRAQLQALPTEPTGDVRPDPMVTQAWRTLQVAQGVHAAKQREQPPELTGPPQGLDLGAVTLQAWAAALEESALAEATDQSSAPGSRRLPLALIAAVLCALAGIALVLTGATAPGLGLIAVGFVAALLDRAVPRKRKEDIVGHTEQRRLIAAQTASAHRAAVYAQVSAASLPADPARLRALAAEVQQWEQHQMRLTMWEGERQAAADGVVMARQALSDALASRGAQGEDPEAAFRDYELACQRRAQQAALAARREVVSGQLNARVAAEQAAAKAAAESEAATSELEDAARAIGLQTASVEALEAWLARQQAAASELSRALDAWSEYQRQLGDVTYEQLREQAQQAQHEVVQLRAAVGIVCEDPGDVDPAELVRLREAAAVAQGRVQDRQDRVPSVAEAEELLALAEAELARVRDLQSTLVQARTYLQQAQETVHRSIAPTLQQTLVRWLPQVTDGRYTQAAVDPESLRVTVMTGSGKWVEASRLSVGTAEQVYLLLRVALAIHLSDPATSCPLLLDDVTVQADGPRTRALLETLVQLAGQRQIILFAQEPTVEQWAHSRDDVQVIALEQVPA